MTDKLRFMHTQLKPPKALLPWLTYEDFLTEKLKASTGDAVLQVLSMRWCLPDWWDTYVLKLTSQSVMHREIIMSAHNKPCWYARMILPIETYAGDPLLFDNLKTKTLGQLIFHGTEIHRRSLTYYAIDKETLEYYWLEEDARNKEGTLWARLSEFSLKSTGASFYLIEILLPGLLEYIT